MQAAAIEWTEWAINTFMFWEPDEKKKARIVRGLHHFVVYAIVTLIIVSHTIYPAFWLQSVLLVICILVWIQHVLTGGCVISKIEQKWLGTRESFVDPIVDLFNIKLAEEDDRTGFVTLGSTVAVLFLSLEWISRASHIAWKLLAQAPQIVSSLTTNIPLRSSFP
jgi:hypothetical protein